MKLTEAEEELLTELTLPEHAEQAEPGWVNFDPDFRQMDIARCFRRGWAEKRGNPPYREYRITEAGRSALRETE